MIIQLNIELGRIESETIEYIPQNILIKNQEKFIQVDVIYQEQIIAKIVHVYEDEKRLYGIIELQEGTMLYNIAKKDMYDFKGYSILTYTYNKNKGINGIQKVERVIVRALPRIKLQIEGENMFPFYQNSDKKERISMICRSCGNVFKIRNVWYDKVKGQMWRCVCGEEYSQDEYDAQRKLYVETTQKQKEEEQARILEEEKQKEKARKALERAEKHKRKTHVEEIVEEVVETPVKRKRKKKEEIIQADIQEEPVSKKRTRKKKETIEE